MIVPNRARLFALACCLIALSLGTWAVDARSLWGDEAFSVWASKQPALTLLAGLDAQPPLYHWLLALARGLWGESVFAIRYLSVCCGVLLVAVGARLGYALGDAHVSVLTALILATSPILIYFEQEVRMYALAALLAGGAMLCAVYALRFTFYEPSQDVKRKTYLVGYAALSIAALFTHFYTVGVLAVNAIALGIAALRSRNLRRMIEWAVAHGAIALVFGGWFFGLQSRYVSRAASGRSRIVPIPEEIITNIGRGLNGLIFGMRADPATTAFAIGLFVIALLGVIGYWRRGKRTAAALIMGWIFTSLVIVLLTAAPSGIVNDFNPRYFLFALLPLALAAAGWALMGRVERGAWSDALHAPRSTLHAALVALIVVLIALPGLAQLLDTSWAKSRYAALVDMIRTRAQPGDGVVLVNSDQFPLMDFYGPAEPATPPTLIVPNGQLSSDAPAVRAAFNDFARDKGRVWLVNYGWAQALQPRSLVEQQLNASGVRTYSQGFQDASLALYDLNASAASGPVTPQFVNFGDEIALTGVRKSAPAYHPGDAITLDLIWQAEQKPKADYTVFMHLRRAVDGGQIAAFDSPPVNGSSPTSSWSQGQVITDTRALQIPADAAPGDYNLVIGLYHGPSFDRLPIAGQGGTEHIAGTVTIGQTPLIPSHTQTPATEWAHRHAITVTNPNATELRDFQVKVMLDETNFDFDRAQPDGADLRFTDQSGTKYIAHWIERFDPVAKQAVVWVKAPQIPASGAQTLYAYYGNPQAEDLSSGRRTFEMFDDFGQPGLGYYQFGPPTTIMTQTLAWETQSPHTLSVVELNRDGYRYWGYYGLADCGGIGVARSNDLVTWDKLPEPLLNNDGERWPSALKVGEAIYVIYDRDHCGTSHLVLRTSTDGLTFDPHYKTIVALEQGVRNQNPALFQDPNTGKFHLYWYRGGAEAGFWQIKMRSADTVEDLANPSSEKVLLDEPYELAAPNMMFHDGTYFLSTEVNENAWKTKIYAGPTPEGPFTPLPDAPQLSDNQACLFQHIMADAMHGAICKIIGADWVLNHRAADLGKGRMAQRALDAGVWTPMGGEWLPVEYGDAFSAGIVLSGTGQGLLKTALSGSDYIFEASGRLADTNAKWGLALRAQDERNMYLLEVERFVNGGSYIRLYSIVDGQKHGDLGGMGLPDDDALIRTTLSVAARGNEFTITRGGLAQTKIVDPESRFMSGHTGLWVNGLAQFDEARWRKVAPQEPATSVGSREDGANAAGMWFSMTRAAPKFAAGHEPVSPAEAPRPVVNSPWLVAMATLTTLVALGIIVTGFVRNRIRG